MSCPLSSLDFLCHNPSQSRISLESEFTLKSLQTVTQFKDCMKLPLWFVDSRICMGPYQPIREEHGFQGKKSTAVLRWSRGFQSFEGGSYCGMIGDRFTAEVLETNIPDKMQREAAEATADACIRYNNYIEISKFIKQTFEKNYGNSWQCIVGKHFAWWVKLKLGCIFKYIIEVER